MSYITTYTGKHFDPVNPDASLLCIEDIAHALSLLCRGNGHVQTFFSVGQHCIQCCREAMARNYVPEVALACLLHDGSEAYLADVTRPVKKNMTMYLQIEEQLQNMIYHKFLGYVPEGEEAVLVKNIDDACLYYEFDHFMGEKLFPVEPVMMGSPSYEVQPMKDVEEEFLALYHQVKKQMEK